MDPYLHRLILEGEHQRLDFKVEISDARKIARSMAAFANTDGGRLLIGVKDDGGIAGIRSEEEIFMLSKAVGKFCRPRIRTETRRWEVGKKTVLEVIISPGEDKPYYAEGEDGRWLAWIRAGDQNLLANRILLRVWERRKQGGVTVVKFTRVEEFLLQHLESHDRITLSDLCRLASVPRFVAEKVLVNLVSMELLTLEITEKEVFYRLEKAKFE